MAALVCVLLTLSGPLLYFGLLDDPFIRSTGLPLIGLPALGLAGGILVARRKKGFVAKAGAGLSALVLAGVVYGFYFWARLPAGDRFQSMDRAPDVALPDTTGREHRLSEALKEGPVLLVFYRGFW